MPSSRNPLAAIVERDHVVEGAAPHVFHAGDLGEKRGELPDPLLEGMDAREGLRLLLKSSANDAPSRCRNREGATMHSEDLKVARKWRATVRASVAIAAIEGGLPAAGLALRESIW